LLIAGIEDGRAHPGELAAVLRKLAAGGWLKGHRLVQTLAEVARVSPLHAWAVASVIEAALDVFLGQSSRANVGPRTAERTAGWHERGAFGGNGATPCGIHPRQGGDRRRRNPRAHRSPSPGGLGRSATSRLGSTPEPG
jgi:hypothetical protein